MVRTNGVKAACTALIMVAGMLMSASAASSDELVTIEKAMYGPYGKQTLVVANSEADWNQMMNALEGDGNLTVVPAPAAPQVDWSRYSVVLLAAGPTGYDVTLKLTSHSNGTVTLDPEYIPLGADGGESLPYHLVMMEKHPWLKTQLWEDAGVATALPMSGSDTSSSTVMSSWGAVKASYR
jgi:hypothetical protein